MNNQFNNIKEENIIDLNEENNSPEQDALIEEKNNLKENITIIKDEIDKLNKAMPFPGVGPYDVADDYEDIEILDYKKRCNQPFWDKKDEWKGYEDSDPIYIGHLQNSSEDNYYFMPSSFLETIRIADNVKFISLLDYKYKNIISMWRYPNKNDPIIFSRNIDIKNHDVKNVYIKYDKNSEIYSNISDKYLMETLKNNKFNPGIVSIISTIQKTQDDIMTSNTYNSFVVQGCAGSGKTMILLHRLEYLIYNKFIDDNYVLLIPNNNFKLFIRDISIKFRINQKNILTYQDYFINNSCFNNQTIGSLDESIFTGEYLKFVYSNELIKEAYRYTMKFMISSSNRLIEYCKTKLSFIINSEKEKFLSTLYEVENKYSKLANSAIIKLSISKIESDFSNYDIVINEIDYIINSINQRYNKKKEELYLKNDILIEEKCKNDIKINLINEEIKNQELKIKKSNIFTINIYKARINKLKKSYEKIRKTISDDIFKNTEKDIQNKLSGYFIQNGLSLSEYKNIKQEINRIYSLFTTEKNNIQNQIEKSNKKINNKYSNENRGLLTYIERSSDIGDKIIDKVDTLISSETEIDDLCFLANGLISIFDDKEFAEQDNKIYKKYKNEFRIFNRTEAQRQSDLEKIFFNQCIKIVKEKFNIVLCNAYKHYWFLTCYCKYLICGRNKERTKYIFADEVQDVSLSELEFIYKYNVEPIMNLFGDVNQVISSNGITEWKSIKFIEDIKFLKQNFRNTNQITNYCNKKLPDTMKMQSIGVDMKQEVEEYSDLQDFNKPKESNTFIVKDEAIKKDLEDELNKLLYDDYKIYTVKEVKGLEFKKVTVFDKNMTSNEKYISYTRSLLKLNIIKNLPVPKYNLPKIMQGEEDYEAI